MKSYIVLVGLILLLLQSSCYQQERSCKEFRTGTFAFDYEIEGKSFTSRFTRTDSLEVAYTEEGTDSSSVRWLNDCEWILQKINPRNRTEAKAVHLKILSTDEDSYTFEYSLVGDTGNKQKGIARRSNSH